MATTATSNAVSPESVSGIETYNPHLGNRLNPTGIADNHPSAQSACVVPAEDSKHLRVSFDNGEQRDFNFQWLRHCCFCPECGTTADAIRSCTVVSFGPDIAPTSVSTSGGDLIVGWNDGHESTYGGDWLFCFAYQSPDRMRRNGWRPKLWRSELAKDFPTSHWQHASVAGSGQLEMYRQLLDHGIVRIQGVGTEPAQTEPLANLIGPIHETTVYGRIYDVKAEPVAKLGAKTGIAQAPHIDDAFCYSPPGIDIFHCLVNTDQGGMSTYADGFAVAEAIRCEQPKAFRTLTTLPITHFRRHPGEINMRHRGPLITLDEFNNPCGIRYFDRAFGPPDVDSSRMDDLYAAVREFNRRIRSSEFLTQIRINPGEAVFIDNHRVMHGRTAFDPSSGRHIRLCHVPRDEFHGRMRELALRFDPALANVYLPQGA